MADPTDSLPPRPDSFANLLLQQQATQHGERMQSSRDLQLAIAGRFDKLDSGQSAIREDLAGIKAGGLGSWERRGMLTGGLVVLLLLILLLATSRGVDTAEAVQGVRLLAPLAASPAAPAPFSAPAPHTDPPAPASASESHSAAPAPVGEPWHDGETAPGPLP